MHSFPVLVGVALRVECFGTVETAISAIILFFDVAGGVDDWLCGEDCQFNAVSGVDVALDIFVVVATFEDRRASRARTGELSIILVHNDVLGTMVFDRRDEGGVISTVMTIFVSSF